VTGRQRIILEAVYNVVASGKWHMHDKAQRVYERHRNRQQSRRRHKSNIEAGTTLINLEPAPTEQMYDDTTVHVRELCATLMWMPRACIRLHRSTVYESDDVRHAHQSTHQRSQAASTHLAHGDCLCSRHLILPLEAARQRRCCCCCSHITI
jgi:hypothetical protein